MQPLFSNGKESSDPSALNVVTGTCVFHGRNGVPVRADGHHVYLSQDGSLIINNAQAGDEGSYTCSAYRGSNSVSASTEVKVVRSSPEGEHDLPSLPPSDCHWVCLLV